MSLSEKRERFCREYIIDLNATQAAKRAGYSEDTSYSQGHRLLKDAEVQKRVQELNNEITSKLEVTAERIIEEYAKLAMTSADDLMEYVDVKVLIKPEHEDPDTCIIFPAEYKTVRRAYLKPFDVLNTTQRAAIQSIKETNQGVEIKLHDKKGALDSLAKIMGMMVDKKVIGGDPDNPINVKAEIPECVKEKLDEIYGS